MKRVLIVLFLMFSMFNASAAVSDSTGRAQLISGFVDDISYLYVSPFTYDGVVAHGYEGINLDYSDTENSIRNLIMPTTTEFTEPGVVIGTFSLLSTFIEAAASGTANIPAVTLTITHGKLTHTTNPDVTLDYELSVLYKKGAEEYRKYCYSLDSSLGSGPKTRIVIDLNTLAQNQMISIQNANIYFRFAKNVAPTVVGQYQSAVTFTLEGK